MESGILPWPRYAPVSKWNMDFSGLRRGLELFNQAKFFEAHEVLEDVWRAAPEHEQQFLQGLIQMAVALHHHSVGNVVGARSVLKRALENLESYPETFAGLDLKTLRGTLEHWLRGLEDGDTPARPPRIQFTDQPPAV